MPDHTPQDKSAVTGTARFFLRFLLLLGLISGTAICSTAPMPSHAAQATASLFGPLGLNTTPSARMEPAGTIRAGLSTLDPYAHATASVQFAAPLNVTLRQSAEISGLNDPADRLYPGLDIKIRLLEETERRPAIALGLISALGHKRMSGEYLVASKRYKDFDFSAGMAWGRLGSAGHFKNPLSLIAGHFNQERTLDGTMPATPHDWFTGPDIGFFGGIEYHIPYAALDGLSLKADWNADRYLAERAAFDYSAPAPWSIGLAYAPRPWIDMGAALVGGEKIMARLSLQSPLAQWNGRYYKTQDPPPLYPHRTAAPIPRAAETSAAQEAIHLHNITRIDGAIGGMMSMLPDERPTPLILGHAARHMANHGGLSDEALYITPEIYGLRGPTIRLIRSDLERALAYHQGSPEEIWRGATLNATLPDKIKTDETHLYQAGEHYAAPRWQFRLLIDNELSLSEEDQGLLYRSALIGEERFHPFPHIVTGGALRVNLTDNLHRLNKFRPTSDYPVRSDIDLFTANRSGLDRAYFSYIDTLKPDLHVSATIGYLEEMYGGLHSEVLYRPFGKTFALGASAALVLKRDPISFLAQEFVGDTVFSGHLHGWYEFPDTPLTLHGKIGQYLNDDIGGTLALSKEFDNGARLDGFVTATNQADYDIFGGTTHLYSGMKLTLPLGHLQYLPESSAVRVTIAPQGRDAGQSLDAPLDLYEITEPLSYRHIARHWTKIVE